MRSYLSIPEDECARAENFDPVLCFHWLRAVPRCVPIGQYREATVLIAESFYLVQEAVLVYFYWLRAVATGAILLVNTWRRVRSLPRVLILYMRLSLSTLLAKSSGHWCVPNGQYLEASALIAESFDLVHEALLVYFYWLRAMTTCEFLLVNALRRVCSLPKVLILFYAFIFH